MKQRTNKDGNKCRRITYIQQTHTQQQGKKGWQPRLQLITRRKEATTRREEWHVQNQAMPQLHGKRKMQLWESVSVCSWCKGVEEVFVTCLLNQLMYCKLTSHVVAYWQQQTPKERNGQFTIVLLTGMTALTEDEDISEAIMLKPLPLVVRRASQSANTNTSNNAPFTLSVDILAFVVCPRAYLEEVTIRWSGWRFLFK